MSTEKQQLYNILDKLDNQEGNEQNLAFQALDLIDTLLEKEPYNIDLFVYRMRINVDIFQDTSKVMEDAQYIMQNDAFGKNTMVGYAWLSWLYDKVLAMPEQAFDTLQEQLSQIPKYYPVVYERDKMEGQTLEKMANIKYNSNHIQKALNLWYQSYKKYPYLDKRNAIAGMYFLDNQDWDKAFEMLWTHYEWSYLGEQDGYRLQYGKKLKKLYDNKQLNHPHLLGLMYHIIRNEDKAFNTIEKLAFYQKFFPQLESLALQNPNNSLIWAAVGNTFYHDLNNYEKAVEAYKKALSGDNPIVHYPIIKKARKCCKKTGQDFLKLTFNPKGLSVNLYNVMGDFTKYARKAKKKKQKKAYIELAVTYGEQGYRQYREYLINGKGDTHNNEPHIFAMHCNNYANALGQYATIVYEDDIDKKSEYYAKAGDIHMEGYAISPFYENLMNASYDYFTAKQNEKSIAASKQLLEIYYDDLDIFDIQNEYWQMTYAYIRLKDITNAEKYYFKAKDFYIKYGKGNEKAEYKFIFTGKLFYEFAVREYKEFEKYIPEMQWYLNEKVALKQKPNEHGLVSYFLGICYEIAGNKNKAIDAYKTAYAFLKEVKDWEYYEQKAEDTRKRLKNLGVNIKKESPSVWQRLKKILLFPIGLFVLIGLMIMTVFSDNNKKEKK